MFTTIRCYTFSARRLVVALLNASSKSLVFTTTAQQSQVSYTTIAVDGFSVANSNTTSNMGGVGLIQHVRDVGYFGVTP